MTLSKSRDLSEPRFPPLPTGDNDNAFLLQWLYQEVTVATKLRNKWPQNLIDLRWQSFGSSRGDSIFRLWSVVRSAPYLLLGPVGSWDCAVVLAEGTEAKFTSAFEASAHLPFTNSPPVKASAMATVTGTGQGNTSRHVRVT